MITSKSNYDLTRHNTFAMQVKCDRWVVYESTEDLHEIFEKMPASAPWLHLGAGSNVLFLGDYPGVVLHSGICGMVFTDAGNGSTTVRVGAGETLDNVIAECCRRGLWGLENLSGIPGEAGASAVQNVGAYGVEAADVIERIEAFDTRHMRMVTFTPTECSYGYRDSMFKHSGVKGRYIITAVTYRLSDIPIPKIDYPALRERLTTLPDNPAEVREAVIAVRDSKLPDPNRVPSAGSFFKNPVVDHQTYKQVCREAGTDIKVPCYETDGGVKIPAAWLIDRCGWKGRTLGGAAVWHLQPLVIVNPVRSASPDDIVRLEAAIIDSVRERFGIKLTPEVEHINH